MKNLKRTLSVRILDANRKKIEGAEVFLKSKSSSVHLNCTDEKGNYFTEEKLPKGNYTLAVTKKPFEEESREVLLKNEAQTEVFFLLKKGTPFYYRGKVKVPFAPDENKIALRIPNQIGNGDKKTTKKLSKAKDKDKLAKELIKKHKLQLEEQPENLYNNGVFICSFPKSTSTKKKKEICKSIEKIKGNTAMPIINLTDKGASMLTNEIMVQFKDYVEEAFIKEVTEELGLKTKRKISALGNLYHLTSGNIPSYEILEKIDTLANMDEVIFAEPNLASTVEEDAVIPTDYLFPEQWDHQILNTPDAWQFLRNMDTDRTFGSSKVIIGVVDSGVDPNHPDFNGTVSDGSSKIYQAFDFANMVANNNSLSSGHGTSCASAAASMVNNTSAVGGVQEGVSGVAGNCRVLAIRRAGDESDYADMYLWAGGFDPESDDDDFPGVINPGADVISSSIGLSSAIGSPTSGTMSAVFDKLTDDGRGGKGTLLFFSAANLSSDNDVTFDRPWGMYNRCFSIAASTLDNAGTNEIQAGYSNFSSQTEFCAPSQDAFVNGSALHNPPTNYGTFTATPLSSPEGHGTVGRPTINTTLNVAANAGNNVVTLNSTAGLSNGQTIMIGDPGNANTEAHIINNVNDGTNQVTLNRNLFNNQANGSNVNISSWDYRSNFGGTSHSTPLCAGVAALMLSANQDLTWTQLRDLMRETAVKINPGENNANGRWQDVNGNPSNSAAYDGTPVFSEFYGFGRIDAAAAVREAGWDIELATTNLNFNDVPEGEQVARAIRFNVKSRWSANFNMSAPGAPFETPMGTTENIGPSADGSTVQEVYLWVTYTGTNDGDQITMSDGRTVTVTNPETDQEWIIPITANTISRPTSAVMLSLDQSGSMDFPSGIGTSKRIDVLRFSANILADVIQEGNGLGIVSFDQDPHDILSLVGPLGPVSPFDVDRTNIKSSISAFSPNLAGATAIGDGIERAQQQLNPVSGYDSKSIIVLTDGKETADKRISDVSGLINDRVFAIGLGKAENIEPAALNAVTNNNNGYMLLTDQLDENSIFKLAKYFLQILAGVNNEDVVVDPDGTLFYGQEHRIPFVLSEADISSDVILMLPNPNLIDFALQSPNGHIFKPSDSATTPGLNFNYGNNVSYYRLNLPVAAGSGERDGKWEAILSVNKKHGNSFGHNEPTHVNNAVSNSTTFRNGIPYSLLVHAYSNLNMLVDATQDSYEPNANICLQVRLNQYGIPLSKKARVVAKVTAPNGTVKTLNFKSTDVGEYTLKMVADYAGVYQYRIMVNGTTLKGRPFTREQVRTVAVWQGGDRPTTGNENPNGNEEGNAQLCELLTCLLSDKNISPELKERLMKNGINVEGMLSCLKGYCERSQKFDLSLAQRNNLRVQLEQLMKTTKELTE